MNTPLELTGTVELIKDERQLEKSYVVDFILVAQEHDRTHHYFMRAFSAGDFDRFRLTERIGSKITVQCYLNGKKAEGKRGTFYTNELRVRSILEA